MIADAQQGAADSVPSGQDENATDHSSTKDDASTQEKATVIGRLTRQPGETGSGAADSAAVAHDARHHLHLPPCASCRGQYDDTILFQQQMCNVNKLEGVDVTARSYPVWHELSNFEEIDGTAGFLEAIMCPRGQAGKVPTSAHVGKEAKGSAPDDNGTNTLL